MNITDFIASIEAKLQGLEFVSTGACPGCDNCGLAEEPHFSWHACDSCGSHLGGDRHPAHGWLKHVDKPDLLVHLNICTNCLVYLANGDLPEEAQ